MKDGRLVAERYADGFDATTPQLGWSMSKSATDLMVGILVEQGVVSLDDDHLRPEWTDERADITVEQLLRMTSGLEWDETYDLGTPITRMLYLEEDMGGYVARQPLAHEPGTVQQYSSGSTTVLCSILTERTGLGADLPRQVLLGPLGLSSAVFEPDATGTPVCSSYLWASPRDWAALGQFALQNGEWNGEQLLPEDWMQRSLTVTDVEETDDPGYGMGWRVNVLPDGSLRWPGLPEDTFYASGHDGQRIIVVPSEGLVVVRLGFTPEMQRGAVGGAARGGSSSLRSADGWRRGSTPSRDHRPLVARPPTSGRARPEESALVREDHQLRPVVRMQLRHDAVDVRLRRERGDARGRRRSPGSSVPARREANTSRSRSVRSPSSAGTSVANEIARHPRAGRSA